MSRKTPLQPWPGPGKQPKVWDDDTLFAHSMRERYIARRKAAREKARRRLDPWYGAVRLELAVKGGRTFACHVVPHLALELADLNCRVRMANNTGWLELESGRAIRGANFFLSARPLMEGNVIPFEIKGPDTERGLAVVEKVFTESKTERRERIERYPELPEWWDHQAIAVSNMDALGSLGSVKRTLGMGGLQ